MRSARPTCVKYSNHNITIRIRSRCAELGGTRFNKSDFRGEDATNAKHYC